MSRAELFTNDDFASRFLLAVIGDWEYRMITPTRLVLHAPAFKIHIRGDHLRRIILRKKAPVTSYFHQMSVNSIRRKLGSNEPRIESTAPESKKARKAVGQKAIREKYAPTGEVATIAELAEQVGITPSQARSALRKARVEKPQGGWKFAASDHEAILAIIRPD